MDELEHGNQGLVDRIRTIRIQLDELSSMIEKKKNWFDVFRWVYNRNPTIIAEGSEG